MLKLYKRGRTGVRYWEAWKIPGMVVVHTGRLGDRGTTKYVVPPKGRTPAQCIQEAAAKPRAEGYVEIPLEDHHWVVVQYKLETWGSPEDVDKAGRIEKLFNERLGWTGNGKCDGNDIGGGTLNILSVVVDPFLGAAALVDELRKKRLLKGAVVAVREGEVHRVVYPQRFKGEFSLD